MVEGTTFFNGFHNKINFTITDEINISLFICLLLIEASQALFKISNFSIFLYSTSQLLLYYMIYLFIVCLLPHNIRSMRTSIFCTFFCFCIPRRVPIYSRHSIPIIQHNSYMLNKRNYLAIISYHEMKNILFSLITK